MSSVFNQMSMKARLMLSFTFMAAVVVCVSGLSMHSLSRSKDRLTDYLDGIDVRQSLATEIRGAANQRAITAPNLVLVTKDADRSLEKAAVTAAHQRMQDKIQELKKALDAGAGVTGPERVVGFQRG